ncbi:src-like-adapter 2 isoform X1 [Varanus komodoensis]|uniref:src-like-adapter 2 isoform X1 n=1 Tax=Varanus komodoensis TaxID=61221 RepID=UPI001CF7E0D6|nr:src-like-adapter 2 isoform X1 [Varanus komodoensis]
MGSLSSRRKPIATPAAGSPQPDTQSSQAPGLGVRPPDADTPIAVMVCDFPSGHAEPILRMGEQLTLLSEDGELRKVESVTTGKQCYIPSNHIAEISHRWLYKGIDRAKAEELLLLPSNCEGSFLIRESQTRKGGYSLSVRHTNFASPDSVKHYRINCLDNSWLYISPRLTFSSMQELVDFYSETGEGLCCCLRESCLIQGSTSGFLHNVSKPVEIKPVLNWQEINRSDLVVEGSLPEDHPISLGLREAVTSYLFITEDLLSESTLNAMQKRSKTT